MKYPNSRNASPDAMKMIFIAVIIDYPKEKGVEENPTP
jgi:hypothetical protein